MPAIEHLKTLFAYHFDTTGRLLDLAAYLSETDYHEDTAYGRGSVHNLLFHILNADNGWRIGMQTGSRPAALTPEDYVDIPTLRRLLAEEQAAWEAMLAGLSDGEVDQVIELSGGPARQIIKPRWIMLHHVLFHGMQHHAEVAQILTEKGHSPGDIDFFYFMWKR